MQMVERGQAITWADAGERLGITSSTAQRAIAQLVSAGKLEKINGGGRHLAMYVVPESKEVPE